MDMTSRLQAFFGELFDTTQENVMRAARHGVSNAINVVRDKTRANVAAMPYRMTVPTRKWGVPMIEGVKAYLHKGDATGFVDILGNRRTNDGTWLLRMAGGRGTKPRVTKSSNAYRGALQGYYVLSNAAASIGSDAATIIADAISKEIDEINK